MISLLGQFHVVERCLIVVVSKPNTFVDHVIVKLSSIDFPFNLYKSEWLVIVVKYMDYIFY